MMTALILEIERQFGLVGVDSFEVSRRDQPSNQYAGADSDSEKVTQVFIYAVNNPECWKKSQVWCCRDGI